MIAEAEERFNKLTEKNSQAEDHYKKKGGNEFIGGYKKWSPQGVVSITPKQWREWKEYLVSEHQGPDPWESFFTNIHKAKQTDE